MNEIIESMAVIVVFFIFVFLLATHERRIRNLEHSIPVPPITTEEAIQLMEGVE